MGRERIGKQYGERQGRWKGEGIEAGRECGKARVGKEIRPGLRLGIKEDGIRKGKQEGEGNDRREKE